MNPKLKNGDCDGSQQWPSELQSEWREGVLVMQIKQRIKEILQNLWRRMTQCIPADRLSVLLVQDSFSSPKFNVTRWEMGQTKI